MTQDEAIAQVVAACPSMSADDLRGLLACRPDEMQALIVAYRDAGKVPGPSAWAVILGILGTCAELAGYVIPLEGAIAGAIGLVKS